MVTAALVADMIMRGCIGLAALSLAGTAANAVKAYARRHGVNR